MHTTYSVNTLKIEYFPPDKPRAANILTLLYWRWELSFDVKIPSLFTYQYKYLHCKNCKVPAENYEIISKLVTDFLHIHRAKAISFVLSDIFTVLEYHITDCVGLLPFSDCFHFEKLQLLHFLILLFIDLRAYPFTQPKKVQSVILNTTKRVNTSLVFFFSSIACHVYCATWPSSEEKKKLM